MFDCCICSEKYEFGTGFVMFSDLEGAICGECVRELYAMSFTEAETIMKYYGIN